MLPANAPSAEVEAVSDNHTPDPISLLCQLRFAQTWMDAVSIGTFQMQDATLRSLSVPVVGPFVTSDCSFQVYCTPDQTQRIRVAILLSQSLRLSLLSEVPVIRGDAFVHKSAHAHNSEQLGSQLLYPSFTIVSERMASGMLKTKCEIITLVNVDSVLLQMRDPSDADFVAMLKKETDRQNRILMFGLLATIIFAAVMLGYAATIIKLILARVVGWVPDATANSEQTTDVHL